MPLLPLDLPVWSRQTVPEADTGMSTVAERFIGRSTATAKSDPVAKLVFHALRIINRNSSPNEQRSAATFLRVFQQNERGSQLVLDKLALLLVPCLQSPGRAIIRFPYGKFPCFLVVGLLDKIPHLTISVTETGESAPGSGGTTDCRRWQRRRESWWTCSCPSSTARC